jgi:catechol 2,3-dioxygenase-like lactoylglutathione lyase family enzyme
MRVRFVFVLAALAMFGPHAALAQTLPYDHMHLAAPDQAKAVEWYKAHMGATPGDLPDRVMVGKVIFVWIQRAGSPTSDGSVVDHIGFSFPDIDAKIAELTAAGAKLLTPAREVQGLFKLAFVEDPFGMKIELVQDAETPGFHHIHLRLPDPDKALAWYSERFGGERRSVAARPESRRRATEPGPRHRSPRLARARRRRDLCGGQGAR